VSPPDRERSVFRAHELIREFVRSATSAAGEDPAALVELLRHTLPAHFHTEERPGGFFDQLAGKGTSRTLLARLRSEHEDCLAELDAIERNLSAGVDVRPALQAVADRLRRHEWTESVSAVQAGLLPPGDIEHEPEPGVTALSAEIRGDLDAVADEVHRLAHLRRDALLAGVTIDVPGLYPGDVLRAALERALSARGLDFVDLDLRPADGELAVSRTWYEPLP
jgi:hypothetical protein